MDSSEKQPEIEQENESYPIEPRYHPIHKVPRKIYDFLASAKLAMALLVAILICCLIGATVIRGERAWSLIFTTLWFNGLLVLLIVNVACCFFGRIWGRRVTLISLGMILFHLSFVSMFVGIIYNSLYYFRGTIRLTEGETLPNNQIQSYDVIDKGRFFNFSRLHGETTLVKMHTGYKVGGDDKRAAYDVSVGDEGAKKQKIIYITNHMEYRGFKYFADKEGYSVLAMLYDKQGNELYGAFVPLQSLRQKDNSLFYSTGSKTGPGIMPFPQGDQKPLFGLQLAYRPDSVQERAGDAFFEVFRLKPDGMREEKPSAAGKAAIGEKFDAGKYDLAVKEVRYWAAMAVRYEPGQPIVLTSLWFGLFGVTLTTLARMFRKRKKI